MTDPALHQLAQLAETITAPVDAAGVAMRLTALMPCEPAVGDVAVACWVDGQDEEHFALLRLADGASIDDPVAFREALALLAMVETLEELASFDVLDDAAHALRTWEGGAFALTDRFERARRAALEALAALAERAPGDAPRVARPAMLDDLGAALRELERAWELLEQAAEEWSDAVLEQTGRDAAALELVQGLWRLLGTVRHGPLAQQPSTALHNGREAGVAMAAAISGS